MLEIIYGNITKLSDKAEHYFLNSQADVFAVGETHLIHEDAVSKAKDLEQKWQCTVAPAQPSKQSLFGSYGEL